jgi:hypothetical protein
VNRDAAEIDDNSTYDDKQAFGLLRSHGGLPVRFESGADPRVDLSDLDHPVMVCDGGILDALLEQRLAVVDHAAGLFRGANLIPRDGPYGVEAADQSAASWLGRI